MHNAKDEANCIPHVSTFHKRALGDETFNPLVSGFNFLRHTIYCSMGDCQKILEYNESVVRLVFGI